MQLRDGVRELFKLCNDKKVPVVIISSGLGDFIPNMLEKEGILFENVYIYSNMFKFDNKGNAVGIGNRIIHTANKRIRDVEKEVFYESVKDRKNIILLGDDLTDLKMSQGFEYDNILKIGFWNENQGDMTLFQENFDVLITGDGSTDFVTDLVNEF